MVILNGRRFGWVRALALVASAGSLLPACEDCDDGKCQNTLLIWFAKEGWEPGEYVLTGSYDRVSFECVVTIPVPARTSGTTCLEGPLVGLAATGTRIHNLSIRDDTPDVVKLRWEYEGVEFASLDVQPSYRKQTRDEYPRVCGRPCDVGSAEVALD